MESSVEEAVAASPKDNMEPSSDSPRDKSALTENEPNDAMETDQGEDYEAATIDSKENAEAPLEGDASHPPSPSPSIDASSPFRGLRELKSLLPSLLEDDWSLHYQGKLLQGNGCVARL